MTSKPQMPDCAGTSFTNIIYTKLPAFSSRNIPQSGAGGGYRGPPFSERLGLEQKGSRAKSRIQRLSRVRSPRKSRRIISYFYPLSNFFTLFCIFSSYYQHFPPEKRCI